MTDICDLIYERIASVLPNASITVADPHHDQTHFEALVISDQFEGMSRVKRHQMVMKSLQNEMQSNYVHALALKTMTPSEWALL